MQQIKILLFLSLFLFAERLGAQQPTSMNMEKLASWRDPNLNYNDIWGYADCDGREYAILGSSLAVHFFDLQDPANPIEIDQFEGGEWVIWRDIKTYGHYAYSVCDGCSEGLMVFDLSDLPNSVSKVLQTDEYFGSAHNIYIDVNRGRLHVIGANTGDIIFDLTQTPENPQLLNNLSWAGGYAHDLFVRNDTAYGSHGFNGLYVHDVSDPQTDLLLGSLTSYPESGYNHASWLSADGHYLVMADETHDRGLKLVDVSDLSDMTVTDVFRSALLGPAETASIPHNPFIRGNLVICSYYHDGVQVFDFSDPENVQQVAWYDTYPDNTDYGGYKGCWGVYPFLPSGIIIASDITYGLFVLQLDESIPIAPLPIDIQADSYPEDLTLSAMPGLSVCEGQEVSLSANAEVDAYQWYQNDALLNGETSSVLQVMESGSYYVALTSGQCTAFSEEVLVDVLLAPSVPEISFDGTQLSSSATAAGYQWFLDGQPIAGANQANYTPVVSGSYSLEITSDNGCTAESEPLQLVISATVEWKEAGLSAWPNPASDRLWLDSRSSESHHIRFYDNRGQLLFQGELAGGSSLQIDLSAWPAGFYLLKASKNDKTAILKIAVQ